MAIFDNDWIKQANRLLDRHRTGAVDEFSVVLNVDAPDAPSFAVIGSDGTVRFSDPAVDPDCTAHIAAGVVATAFQSPDQRHFIGRAMSDGSLFVDGDLAKARFFLEGFVRGADPKLVAALAAIE